MERLRAVMTSADRVLLPRAAQTRDVLVTELRRLGVHVEEVAAYTTRRAEAGTARLREALTAGSIDAVIFTSASTARNFAELFSEEERRAWLGRVTVASIGPITAATAAEYGMTTDVMPVEYTIPALARAPIISPACRAVACRDPGAQEGTLRGCPYPRMRKRRRRQRGFEGPER